MKSTSQILSHSPSLKDYVAGRVNELKAEQKKLNKRYFFWSSILLAFNICSIVLSVIGIILVVNLKETKPLYSTLTALAAAIVIVLFILQFTNIIFRSMMRNKYYHKGSELIQNEYFRYETNQGEYAKLKTQDLKQELLNKNTSAIFKDAIQHKRKKNKTKLIFRAMVGGEDALKTVEHKVIIYRRVFYTLSTITILLASLSSVLTTLMLSRQVSFLVGPNSTIPDWYFFTTAGVSAIGTFFAGMINFFVIRDKIKTFTSQKEDIINEMIDYTNTVTDKYKDKVNRDYDLYVNIALIIDADLKRKEVTS